MKATILSLVQGQEYNTRVYHNCTICPDDKERKILRTYRTGTFVEAHCYSTQCPAHGPHRFYTDTVNPEAVKRMLLKKEKQNKQRWFPLPETFSYDIPQKFIAYLAGYGIDRYMMQKYDMGYVMQHFYNNKLIFEDRLVIPTPSGFVARSLEERPKWKNFCDYDFISIGQTGDCVVLVEDPLSCIRVGEVMPCICLFGTTMKEKQFINVMKYKEVLIWLDNDSAGIKGRTKIKARLDPYIKNRFIIADKDPKEYDKDEIRGMLREECV